MPGRLNFGKFCPLTSLVRAEVAGLCEIDGLERVVARRINHVIRKKTNKNKLVVLQMASDITIGSSRLSSIAGGQAEAVLVEFSLL